MNKDNTIPPENIIKEYNLKQEVEDTFLKAPESKLLTARQEQGNLWIERRNEWIKQAEEHEATIPYAIAKEYGLLNHPNVERKTPSKRERKLIRRQALWGESEKALEYEWKDMEGKDDYKYTRLKNILEDLNERLQENKRTKRIIVGETYPIEKMGYTKERLTELKKELARYIKENIRREKEIIIRIEKGRLLGVTIEEDYRRFVS